MPEFVSIDTGNLANTAFDLEMITRDPLKIPVFTSSVGPVGNRRPIVNRPTGEQLANRDGVLQRSEC